MIEVFGIEEEVTYQLEKVPVGSHTWVSFPNYGFSPLPSSHVQSTIDIQYSTRHIAG